MSKREAILVTGGAGYIGSHTVRHLAATEKHIVVLDSLEYGHRAALVSPNVELVTGNLGDPLLVEDLFSRWQFSAVLHFAAYVMVGESVSEPVKYYQNNVAAPLVILEAMRRHGVKHFIFSSTCATFGNPQHIPMDEEHPQVPINPYGQSKLMLEKILRDCDHAYGIRHVVLRYFNASGSSEDGVIGEDHTPESHIIPRTLMAITGEAPEISIFGTDYPTPDGTCIRDYIHVLDLADAHARALEYLRRGEVSTHVNLGTGTGVSVREIIRLAEEVTGRKVPVIIGPRRPGDPPELVGNPAKAKEVLGWEASRKDPRTMVESAWAWLNGPRKGRYPAN